MQLAAAHRLNEPTLDPTVAARQTHLCPSLWGTVALIWKNVNADAAWAGIRSNLAKAIIRVYKNEIHCGHFEHLM